MNKSVWLSRAVGVGWMLAGTLGAQTTPPVSPGAAGPAAEVLRAYTGLKSNILRSANSMPGENFSFRPTPDVRSFARVVNHITEAQMHSCGAVNGTPDSAAFQPPAETADKATIVKALEASFATCDRAMVSLTEANALEMLSAGAGKRSRIGLLWGTASHDNEQYATLALYMRLKGLVPPSSEK